MRFARLLNTVCTVVVTIALVGLLAVSTPLAAQGVTERPIPIKGVKTHGKFFIRGNFGPGFAKQRVKVQRQVRPGAKWSTWRRIKTSKKGIYRQRIYRVSGSKATCYRIRVKAVGGFSRSTSQAKCVVRVG